MNNVASFIKWQAPWAGKMNALWLATRAGKMELSCPLGFLPQEKFPKCHMINPVLSKLVWSRWLDVHRVLLCASVDLHCTAVDSFSVHCAQKRTWPMRCHLDLTLGHMYICTCTGRRSVQKKSYGLKFDCICYWWRSKVHWHSLNLTNTCSLELVCTCTIHCHGISCHNS